MKEYPGNYSQYLERKAKEEEERQKAEEKRAMLTEFVKKAGVPFRERGGTYFVARSYRLELTAFRELLPLIHRENNIRWMPIAGIGDMDIIAR